MTFFRVGEMCFPLEMCSEGKDRPLLHTNRNVEAAARPTERRKHNPPCLESLRESRGFCEDPGEPSSGELVNCPCPSFGFKKRRPSRKMTKAFVRV